MRFIGALLDQPERPVGQKVIRNTAFSVVRLLLVAPVPFLLVPFVLARVGPSIYGTWSVFTAIIALSSLTDLGLTGTISKHVSEHYTRRDFAALERLLSSGLVLYGSIAGTLFAVLAAMSSILVKDFFHDSVVPAAQLRSLFDVVLALGVIALLTLPFKSVLIGLQRLDLATVLATLNVLVGAALTVMFLSFGWSLTGLVLASGVTIAATFCLHVWIVARLMPQVRINPLRARLEDMRAILTFSLQVFVTQAAVTVHNQLEKVYLAALVGVVSAGWFDIASDIAAKLRTAPSALLTPVMPAAAELSARGDESALLELHDRTHKYLACCGVPLVFLVGIFATRFVELWLGTAFRVIALPLAILVAVNFVNLMTGPGYLILLGQGNLRPGVLSALVGISVNVVVSFVLIKVLGFPGAVFGTSLALMVGAVVFLVLFHRRTGFPVMRVVRTAYLKPLACAGTIVAAFAVAWPARGATWGGLVVQGIAFAVLYCGGLMLLRQFDAKDLAIVETLVPGLRLPRGLFRVA